LGTWNAYGNQYWPAEYLIDAQGRVRAVDFGEGGYAEKERAIRALLAENGDTRLGAMTRAHGELPSQDTTPESYLGSARAERFSGQPPRNGTHSYGTAPTPSPDHLAYGGPWSVSPASATAGPGAMLKLSFQARRVFLVLGSPGATRTIRVLLDGRPITASAAGSDVHAATVAVHQQRLYTLVDLPWVQRHILTLLPRAGITGYAFTFG
jgi:hypothetical protein